MPVTVLSGFLGAGKTCADRASKAAYVGSARNMRAFVSRSDSTLLNHMLNNRAGYRIAVVRRRHLCRRQWLHASAILLSMRRALTSDHGRVADCQ